MRVLFYTATALFILLAGVFAFYALQMPQNDGAARVVLSIDSSKMPAVEAQADEGSAQDQIAEAAAKLKRIEAETTPPEGMKPSLSASEPVSADTPPSDNVAAADGGQAAQAQAEPEPQKDDALPDVLPGTTLAGVDNDQPPSKQPGAAVPGYGMPAADAPGAAGASSAQAAPSAPGQASSPQPQLTQQTTPPDLNSAAENTENLPEATANSDHSDRSDAPTALNSGAKPAAAAGEDTANASAPPSQTDAGKGNPNTVLAALNEKESLDPAVPAVPPPPLPYKRPAGIPAPIKTALLGWGNTRLTTTKVAVPRSARIAVLLRGVGRDDRISEQAVTKLPPAVSLAFIPYASSAQQWAKKARELGHEVIVQLPLEPSDYSVNNPGPETLLSSSSADENLSRLRTILARFDGYSGVTNFLGGKLLQSPTALRPILEEVKTEGLIYVGEGNNSHAIARGVAKEIGLRYGNADVMIDAQPSPTAIRRALDRLIVLARKQGSAIGMGTASRTTIEQIENWSRHLEAEGVTLVPVGVLAQTPGAS